MKNTDLETNNTDWIYAPCKSLDHAAQSEALNHQSRLTKPPGSLGELEHIAVQFAAWQGTSKPQLENILVRIFAGDHGICAQNVSAFPQAVTQQMVANFINGGAAISVLSRQLGADFAVVNLGTVEPTPNAPGLVNEQLAAGSRDFTQEPAMDEALLAACLAAGRDQAVNKPAELFIGGDMGIGNTTAASAIYSLMLDLPLEQTVGPGTGLDQQGVQHKCRVLESAISLHQPNLNTPIQVLRHVGGLEIAALTGAYISAAQQGIPILVDGFICTAAALLAAKINPAVRDWMLFAHRSAEPAHSKALDALKAQPMLDLGMRLGEGSGAAVAVNLIESALLLHNNMATFDEAGVSNRD